MSGRLSGKSHPGWKHGGAVYGSRAPEYGSWENMKDRCVRENHRYFHRYGGRGIAVCKRWRENFAAFLEDMGPRPGPGYSIDRIDNDRGYEPGNCRWATHLMQQANRTALLRFTIQGRTEHLAEWCRIANVPYSRVITRLKHGWDIETALFEPIHVPSSDPDMVRKRQRNKEAAKRYRLRKKGLTT